LFYAVFGLVVTSFVRIAGVLLVFSYLIVPAVCGINLARRISHRLLIGWIIALIGGVAGLFFSFWWDLPSGAAIVCTFGVLLIMVSIGRMVSVALQPASLAAPVPRGNAAETASSGEARAKGGVES